MILINTFGNRKESSRGYWSSNHLGSRMSFIQYNSIQSNRFDIIEMKLGYFIIKVIMPVGWLNMTGKRLEFSVKTARFAELES